MDKNQKHKYTSRAKIIKSMAHPTRLLIIDELAKGERCVNELTEMVGDDKSTVSKHISVLKNAGLLEDDKRGASIYYKLKCPCVTQYFDCIEQVLKRNSKDYLKAIGG
ncbi:MAG: metalloregulator ArsR/SmtB family transcription factor [Pseudomonadota bacterium]